MPGAVGGDPSGVAHTIWSERPPTACCTSAVSARTLSDAVAVAQRTELAARPVDDRRVAGELATRRHARRALVLEEHADTEVHRDLPTPRVLAAAEQRRVFPFAGRRVVAAGVVDAVRHHAIAAEGRHQRAGSGHLVGIPHGGVGLGGHGALAVDVLHHAVADAHRVVRARRHSPERSVMGADERERSAVLRGAGAGPRRDRRRRRNRAAEPVALRCRQLRD